MKHDNSYLAGFSDINIPAIFKQSAYSMFFYLIMAFLAFLVFLLPLSYLAPSQIGGVWNAGLFFIWFVALFSAGLYFAYLILFKRYKILLMMTALLSNATLLALAILMSLSGLVPVASFINPIILSTPIIFFLGDTLYRSCIRYENYLARSVNFATDGMRLFLAIGIVSFFTEVALLIPIIRDAGDNLLSEILPVAIQILALMILLINAHNFQINEPRRSSFSAIVVFLTSIFVIVASYSLRHEIDLWWLGIFTFLSSLYYVAHSPTRFRATTPAILLYSCFALLAAFQTLGVKVTFEQGIGFLIGPVIAVITLIITIAQLFAKPIETYFKSLTAEPDKIPDPDVIKACQEIIDKEGVNLNSINDIVAISIITRNFSFCDMLVKDKRLFYYQSKDLYNYFLVYYLTARVKVDGKVVVDRMVKVSNQEGEDESILVQQTLVADNDFEKYLANQLTRGVRDYEIWSAYRLNSYIGDYPKMLAKVQAPSWITKVWNIVRNTIIVFFVLALVLNPILPSLFQTAPNISQALSSIGDSINGRLTNLKLSLVETLKPYENTDDETMAYFAENIYYWTIDWDRYNSTTVSGKSYLEPEEFDREIEWYSLSLGLCKTHGWLYRRVSRQLGQLYIGLKNYEFAVLNFQNALEEEDQPTIRDGILANLTKSLVGLGKIDEAQQVVMEVKGNAQYPLANQALGNMYYQLGQYDDIVNTLSSQSMQLDSQGLILLGKAYLELGELQKAESTFQQVENDLTMERFDPEIHFLAMFNIARTLSKQQEYTKAAQAFYQALSTQWTYEVNVLSLDDIRSELPTFRQDLDMARNANSADFRLNLWNAVYYFYLGNWETGKNYLSQHLSSSPTYEPEFTKFLVAKVNQ